MNKFASIVLKNRVLIIVLCLVITIILGIQLRKIEFNSDVITYLPADDESVVLFKYIGKEYSSSWTAIIMVESDSIFSKDAIENISKLTDTLRITEGIEFVTSITNILDIKKTEFGIEISRLIDPYELPQTDEELSILKSYVTQKDIYKGQIVSESGKYTLIICQIDEAFDKNEIAIKIREIGKSFNFPEKLYFEGMPFQVQGILQFILDDLLLLTPLIVIIILLVLLLSFKNFKDVLLPILAVGMGIIWTISLMAVFGVKFTPLSDALPVVLFAVGSAYGIHVVNRIKLNAASSENKNTIVKTALSEVGLAVILAGVTTFVGFLSFIFSSYLNIVRDFGIFAALGVIFTLINSITFIPALASFFNYSDTKKQKNAKEDTLTKLLNGLASFIITYKKAIFYTTIGVLIISCTGIPLIKRKVDILEYFKPDTEIRKSAKIMNSEFGGSLPIQIVVNGDILSTEALNKMKQISLHLKNIEGISNVRSVADYIEQMNDAMDEGKCIPDSKDKISNLWIMIESEEIMEQMINYEKTEAIMYATMKNLDAEIIHQINDNINEYVKNLSDEDVQFRVTGLQAVYSKLDDSMMNNLMQSMILAFIFIFVTMYFLIGSFKGAFTGMITLVFSIVFVFGFMGFTGIALDIATILIASITVGIGVDYSIHFVTAYKNYLMLGYAIDDAIKNTIYTTGRAIVINVFTIIAGFLVLLFANLIPLQQFGILIAVTMFCSGFGSITLMPAIISMFKIKIIKKKIN